MRQGIVAGLLDNLDWLLTLPIRRVIPGHFAVTDKAGLAHFRDYVRAIYDSARAAVESGETIADTLPAALKPFAARSEERRVGKEWVSPCRSRGSPAP